MRMETVVGIRCTERRRNFRERCTKKMMAVMQTVAQPRGWFPLGLWMWPRWRRGRGRPRNYAATWPNCPVRGLWEGTSRGGSCMIPGNVTCITSRLPKTRCRSGTSKSAMRVSATTWRPKRVSSRSTRAVKSSSWRYKLLSIACVALWWSCFRCRMSRLDTPIRFFFLIYSDLKDLNIAAELDEACRLESPESEN